jgi:hypothetical protein
VKNIILLVFLIFAVKVYSVDYTHCQNSLRPPGISTNGFPFAITDDGTIRPHSTVNMAVNAQQRTTTITVPSAYEGYPDQTIIVRRNERGEISQFETSYSFRAPPTRSGLGTNNPWGMIGGVNPFVNGVGFGGPMVNSDSVVVTDVKMVNGKCFPYRSVAAMTTNNHTHRSFTYDVELCRDIRQFNQNASDATNRLSQLKSCYDEYIRESQRLIDAHKTRNNDLYNPPRNQEERIYGGIFEGEGGFSEGQPEGQTGWGQYGMGGFGMSVDTVVNNPMLNASQKIMMLGQACSWGYVAQMAADDSLFPRPQGLPVDASDTRAQPQ